MRKWEKQSLEERDKVGVLIFIEKGTFSLI